MAKFENLGSYVEAVWKTQGALAEKLDVSKQTVSQWVNGKMRVSHEYQMMLREMTPPYDGEFPDVGAEGIRAEDLQELGRQEQARYEDLKRDIAALGAAVQELLKRTPPR